MTFFESMRFIKSKVEDTLTIIKKQELRRPG
jgi:hypothetical protein